MRVLMWLLVALIAMAAPAQAQLTGTVTSARTGEPLAAVQVSIDGTDISTLTDASGRYILLQVPPGTHTLVAQRIGYAAQRSEVTVAAGQPATVNVRLTDEALVLEGVVAVGYGTLERRQVTGAVV